MIGQGKEMPWGSYELERLSLGKVVWGEARAKLDSTWHGRSVDKP